MSVWQGILIVLGCIVIGSLVGILLLRLLRRTKKRDYSLLDQEAKTIKAVNTAAPVTATSKEITKSNGHEDPLEVLIKNHKNNVVAERAQQPKVINVPGIVERTALNNPPVIAKEEKPAPHVMHWTELVTPSDQLKREKEELTHGMPAVKEPVAVSQKSTSSRDEPQKTAVPDSPAESGIITRETPPLAEKQEKSPKSAISVKSETITRKSHPVVHGKTKAPKLTVPEAAIIKSEIVQQKPPELKPEESTKNEPTAAPAAGKPEIAIKTDLIMEMEANLVTASQPWDNKLRSFQTKCWDSKHGQTDVFLNSRYQEMIQLYVDIGLANNIVWLATEIGHRTKELDESYIKLRSGIAGNIKKLLS